MTDNIGVYDIARGLYGRDHIRDTEIIDGVYALDTVRITFDNGTVVEGGFHDDEYATVFLYSYYVPDGDYRELMTDEAYDCGSDMDVEGVYEAVLALYKRYAD